MPAKRSVIEQLTREELIAVVAAVDLAVDDKRVKANLVEAVASSKKARLEAILGDLSRERLKEICRGIGVDDSGREKQALIERLTGASASTNGAPSSRRTGAAREPDQVEPQLGEKLTLDKLERHLWSAADILRG
jgi:type I restriction enzyme M protein